METPENTDIQPQATPVQTPVQKIAVPNATAVLVLGIFAIVTSWCCGFIAFVGLTLGIIALALASKAQVQYNEAPEKYTESSAKNLNAGRICAIIGIVISGLLIMIGIIYMIIFGATLGSLFSTIPWENIINY